MKISPKISIVIPSYNKAKFIKQTLDSIMLQDYPNLEVIVQDGGSKDGSLKIIQTYINKYPKKIFLESKKDKGQTDAINKGFKKASGDIITFINADDLYEKNAFAMVAKYYSDKPDAIWFAGRGIVIDEKGREIAGLVTFYKNILLRLNWYVLLLIVNYPMQPSVFITKKAYKKYNGFTGVGKAVLEYDKWLTIGKDQMPNVINATLSRFRLYKSAFSSSASESILREDMKTVKKFTNNNLVLILHLLHNFARKFLSK